MVMVVIINMVLMMLTMSMLIVVQSHYDTIVLSLHALTVRPSTGSVRPSVLPGRGPSVPSSPSVPGLFFKHLGFHNYVSLFELKSCETLLC